MHFRLQKQNFFSSKGSLIRVVALAAAGSGLIYSCSNINSGEHSLRLWKEKTSIHISFGSLQNNSRNKLSPIWCYDVPP